jgi:glycine cleavage system H protein
LGDIIFVEFPDTDQEIELDEPFGTIEAVKTVADLFGPLTGRVVEINDILEDNPEKVNEDSYGDGWILKISISNPGELDALLSADQYASLIS